MEPYLTDIMELRRRARSHTEEGAVTEGYRADREIVLRLLNELLPTTRSAGTNAGPCARAARADEERGRYGSLGHMVDDAAGEKSKYVDAFLENVGWDTVERRFKDSRDRPVRVTS